MRPWFFSIGIGKAMDRPLSEAEWEEWAHLSLHAREADDPTVRQEQTKKRGRITQQHLLSDAEPRMRI